MMENGQKLVETLFIEGQEEVVSIFDVNGNYFSVVYKEKEEYYSKDLKKCILVGKMILKFYQDLSKSGNLLYVQNTSEEERWQELLRFLNKESEVNFINRELCISIYNSIEKSYYDMGEFSDEESVKLYASRCMIRGKDNLMKAIKKVVSTLEEEEQKMGKFPKGYSEAEINYNRYKRERNEFIGKNSHLKLELI